MPAVATPSGHRLGEPGFRRLSTALFAAGLATFALLYSTQSLLPALSDAFGVSPSASSLSLAVATAALGAGLLPAAWLSNAVGRTPVMAGALTVASATAALAAAAPSFPALLVARGLEGLALSGLPAVGMAYLAEEVEPGSLGAAIGLYIGGNAVGGMLGRLVTGLLADVAGWRIGLAGIAAMAGACTAACLVLLPRSRRFVADRARGRALVSGLRRPLGDPALVRLNLMGALLMGTFVAVFNGLAFRLAQPPFGLGPAGLGLVYLVYPIGSASSARAGRLADRFGRHRVLPAAVAVALAGLGLTAAGSLTAIVAGVAVLTAGFFAGHAVSSSWVGRRAAGAAGQASALYLLAYYTGSSVAGPLAGAAWTHARWDGVLGLAGGLLALAMAVALSLRRAAPAAPPGRPA